MFWRYYRYALGFSCTVYYFLSCMYFLRRTDGPEAATIISCGGGEGGSEFN